MYRDQNSPTSQCPIFLGQRVGAGRQSLLMPVNLASQVGSCSPPPSPKDFPLRQPIYSVDSCCPRPVTATAVFLPEPFVETALGNLTKDSLIIKGLGLCLRPSLPCPWQVPHCRPSSSQSVLLPFDGMEMTDSSTAPAVSPGLSSSSPSPPAWPPCGSQHSLPPQGVWAAAGA